MTARKPVKKLRQLPCLVAVIMSRADLDSAIRLRKPPDLFELRLEQLAGDLDAVENKVPKLRRPLIITARHPQEGGANKLSTRHRRDLLLRFLHGPATSMLSCARRPPFDRYSKWRASEMSGGSFHIIILNPRRARGRCRLKHAPRNHGARISLRLPLARTHRPNLRDCLTSSQTETSILLSVSWASENLARFPAFFSHIAARRLFTPPLSKTTLKAKCRSNNFAASELVEVQSRLF